MMFMLSFGLGLSEIVLVGLLAVATIGLKLLRRPEANWCLAATICGLVAALVTPSDPLSMLIATTIALIGWVFVSKQILPHPTKA